MKRQWFDACVIQKKGAFKTGFGATL